MAYNRAPRRLALNSQTGPNVSPNSYQMIYDDCRACKGTNWAPFLTCCGRKTVPTTDTPSPNTYYPKSSRKIIGGASILYTEPRFQDFYFHGPGPGNYDPYHVTEELMETEQEPLAKLNGFMYHCNVPYTLLGYTPTIPNPRYRGLVKCCGSNRDTTNGPGYYHVSFDTFCTCYKGCYSGRRKSKRNGERSFDYPGVGSYDIVPQPNPMEDYLNKLRDQRKKNACSLRYMDQVQFLAIRNNYPAPNQYEIEKINKCPKYKKKIVPKRLIRLKKFNFKDERSPGPNAYTDPRTALGYLVKPSCEKNFNAFLVNASRFEKEKPQDKPGPDQYYIKSFVEETAKKISPYAIKNTAFDTSVPKKLYYLPPEYPKKPIRKPCKCSETPEEPEPLAPKPNPTYPFSSKTQRFKTLGSDYEASCASYNITQPFIFTTAPKSFRKTKRSNFLSSEKRFAKVTNFAVMEDKSYIPGPTYSVLACKPCRDSNRGAFTDWGPRFPIKVDISPGPLDYFIQSARRKTFNVTLGGSHPRTPFQRNMKKLRFKPFKFREEQGKCLPEKKECSQITPINIQLPTKAKLRPSLTSMKIKAKDD